MKKISVEIIKFLEGESFAIISTIGENGFPHSACKDIIKIDPSGRIYLLDVYLRQTHKNLLVNPKVSITAVNEHKFKGYCLKGEAKIIERREFKPEIIKAWEEKITSRITRRLIKNMREEKGHPAHPEAAFPGPEYMIMVEVTEIIDLTPQHLKAK